MPMEAEGAMFLRGQGPGDEDSGSEGEERNEAEEEESREGERSFKSYVKSKAEAKQ